MSSWPCYILFNFETCFIEVFGLVANAETAKIAYSKSGNIRYFSSTSLKMFVGWCRARIFTYEMIAPLISGQVGSNWPLSMIVSFAPILVGYIIL